MALEKAPDGSERTQVFYCDPNAAYQKPHVEINHEFIRRILPEGTSFDNLIQPDIDRMMNHINSYNRKKRNDLNPIQSFSFLYGPDIPDLLHLTLIRTNDIILIPDLLKK